MSTENNGTKNKNNKNCKKLFLSVLPAATLKFAMMWHWYFNTQMSTHMQSFPAPPSFLSTSTTLMFQLVPAVGTQEATKWRCDRYNSIQNYSRPLAMIVPGEFLTSFTHPQHTHTHVRARINFQCHVECLLFHFWCESHYTVLARMVTCNAANNICNAAMLPALICLYMYIYVCVCVCVYGDALLGGFTGCAMSSAVGHVARSLLRAMNITIDLEGHGFVGTYCLY